MDASREARARFAEFELDLRTGELRRRGILVAVPEQPRRVLELLVQHAGELVSRDELRACLWPADTFVDFEHGLNAAVKRLRDILGDAADRPRFVETVPKRGYRFVAPVEGLERPAPEAVIDTVGPTSVSTVPPDQRVPQLAVLAIGLGLVGAAAIAWGFRRAPVDEAPPPPQAAAGAPSTPQAAAGAASTIQRLTFESGLQTDPAVSPNGTLIAYASDQSGNFDIWVRPVDGGGDPIQLTDDPADDTEPDWAPDGQWIVFRSERAWNKSPSQPSVGGIFRVSIESHRVERIMAIGYRPCVSPDGRHIAVGSSPFSSAVFYLTPADGSALTRVSGAPGGPQTMESTAVGWHPSGRLTFLHGNSLELRLSALTLGSAGVTEGPTSDDVQAQVKALRLVPADREPLAWSRDGRTLYFVGIADRFRSIWRVTVEPRRLSIVEGPTRVTTAGADSHPATAARGGIAFASSTSDRRVWLLQLDASGRSVTGLPEAVTPADWNAAQPSLSPDGRSLVVEASTSNGARELRLVDLRTKTARPLRRIAGNEAVFMTHWSPDGQRLLFGYRSYGPEGPRYSIRVLDLGSLQESNITSDGEFTGADNPWGWSHDGTSVLANGSRYANGNFALARLPLAAAPSAERRATVLVSSSDRGLWHATESPDGRWICYNATDTREGRDSILYVMPAGGGTPRVLIGTGEWDDYPRWSSDSRHVYFASRRGGRFALWAVAFDSSHGKAIGSPFKIAPFSVPHGSTDLGDLAMSSISVAASRVAVPVPSRIGAIWLVR
jgi:Tol biopolymer transport system component/DNA-binding winged helix-turn-helix (wHTH) protein